MSRIPGRARPRAGRPRMANIDPTALPAPGPSRVLVELAGVEKTYISGAVTTPALRGVDLTIGAGEMVAVVGPSGSGKSTVTNLIAGIDRPTAGTVTVAGRRIDTMSEEALARWRGDTVGIVFQFFQLLPTLTALENVALPLDFARRGGARGRRRRARDLLGLVGLGDKADRLPMELSGGEQQRVAIARALACEPALLDRRRADGQPRLPHRGRDVRPARRRAPAGDDRRVGHPRPAARRPAPRTVTVRDGRIVDDSGPGDLRRPAAPASPPSAPAAPARWPPPRDGGEARA